MLFPLENISSEDTAAIWDVPTQQQVINDGFLRAAQTGSSVKYIKLTVKIIFQDLMSPKIKQHVISSPCFFILAKGIYSRFQNPYFK